MGQFSDFLFQRTSAFWAISACVSLFIYYIASSVSAYWRLRHFQGPPLAAWTWLWWFRAVSSGKGNLRLSEVNKKYGPLARIGPDTLVTSDPELYRRINSRNTGYSRGSWYRSFRLGADKENLISELDNDLHHKLRKQLAPGYSGKDNLALEPDMDKVIWAAINSWKSRYMSKDGVLRPMDLGLQMQFLTIDIITALTYGEALGFVKTDSDLYDVVATTNKNLPVIALISAVPLLNWALGIPWIQRMFAPSINDRVGMGRIKAVTKEVVARRFAEYQASEKTKVKSDMTASFIAHKLTLAEITDNALLNILAGSDTTATSLRTGFISITTQPRILRKLQAEIDGAGVPLDQIISYARLLELPYLQACMKESLRFHPVATGLLPRVVPPQGDYYNGQFIPGGTLIGQCGWNILHLNFDTFGQDADCYRPERWIEATEAARAGDRSRLDKMERVHELVWSSGEFKCLGFQIALMELGKILFETFRRFDLGFVNGFSPLEKESNFSLFVQEGMWMRVEER